MPRPAAGDQQTEDRRLGREHAQGEQDVQGPEEPTEEVEESAGACQGAQPPVAADPPPACQGLAPQSLGRTPRSRRRLSAADQRQADAREQEGDCIDQDGDRTPQGLDESPSQGRPANLYKGVPDLELALASIRWLPSTRLGT